MIDTRNEHASLMSAAAVGSTNVSSASLPGMGSRVGANPSTTSWVASGSVGVLGATQRALEGCAWIEAGDDG
jgi:hypothetical protein